RKVLQESEWRYPGEIEPHLPVTSQNEERLRHIERPAAVRHDDLEVREIDGDVVELHRIAVLGARARKNARARMDHHGQPTLLAAAINPSEALEPVRVRVGGEALVWRVHLQEADAQVYQPVDVARRVFREPRVNASVWQETHRIGPGVLCAGRVGRGGGSAT